MIFLLQNCSLGSFVRLADQIFHLLSDLRSRRSQNVQEQVMAVITRRLGAVASTLRVLNLKQNTLTLELLFQDGRVMSPTEAKFPKSFLSLRSSAIEESGLTTTL